jgi:hypothetical protein
MRNNRKEMVFVFVSRCRFENEYSKRIKESGKLNLIRRDGRIVPWNIKKVKPESRFGIHLQTSKS